MNKEEQGRIEAQREDEYRGKLEDEKCQKKLEKELRPTDKQLENIFHLYNEYADKTVEKTCLNIWNYVYRELNQKFICSKCGRRVDNPNKIKGDF